MSNKPLITIIRDGESFAITPEPSSYSTTATTMIDSGTSVSGKTLGSVVRDVVAQVSLSWKFLTTEQWASINSFFKSQDGNEPNFTAQVIYYDQTLGDWVDTPREMIVSNRSAGMSRYDATGAIVEGWFDCSLELTEV